MEDDDIEKIVCDAEEKARVEEDFESSTRFADHLQHKTKRNGEVAAAGLTVPRAIRYLALLSIRTIKRIHPDCTSVAVDVHPELNDCHNLLGGSVRFGVRCRWQTRGVLRTGGCSERRER